MTTDTEPQTAGWPLPGVQVGIAKWKEEGDGQTSEAPQTPSSQDLWELEPGNEGEICLSGPGIARGYLGLPSLTAERFVRFPCKPGRCYRTGDCGRWVESGAPEPYLEVLGRRDTQIKLNGERIELGEVEKLLGMSPLVLQCAAMPWGDQVLGGPNFLFLVLVQQTVMS